MLIHVVVKLATLAKYPILCLGLCLGLSVGLGAPHPWLRLLRPPPWHPRPAALLAAAATRAGQCAVSQPRWAAPPVALRRGSRGQTGRREAHETTETRTCHGGTNSEQTP